MSWNQSVFQTENIFSTFNVIYCTFNVFWPNCCLYLIDVNWNKYQILSSGIFSFKFKLKKTAQLCYRMLKHHFIQDYQHACIYNIRCGLILIRSVMKKALINGWSLIVFTFSYITENVVNFLCNRLKEYQ